MQPLLTAFETLTMQCGVKLPRTNAFHAIALFPRRSKTVGVVAAAEETWAMPGGECGRLGEKEQFCPTPAAHHLAPPAPEFADAGDPCRARPAFFQQGLRRGIVDDAAIAGEHSAMRRRDDVAGGCDAVLEGHIDLRELSWATLQATSRRASSTGSRCGRQLPDSPHRPWRPLP